MLLKIALALALTAPLDCPPPMGASPLIQLVSPSSAYPQSRKDFSLVFRGNRSSSTTDWPWDRIASVELVPESGNAFVTTTKKLVAATLYPPATASDREMSVVVMHVGQLPPNTNYRIVMDLLLISDNAKCPVGHQRFVIGSFTTER